VTKSFAVTLARFMLRTANTPLRAVWAWAYWSVTRAAAIYLRRQHRGSSIYLKGSFVTQEAVYGVSDIDLMVVLPGDGSQHGSLQQGARESWKQFCRRISVVRFAIQHCWFYEEDDLQKSLSAPCLTYGLTPNDEEQIDDRAAFLGASPLHDHMSLQTHPSLYGARIEWRRLDGKDRLPQARPGDPQSRRITVWLDLQYWWRHAFLACADPARDHVPLLCVKLIAEPVRLWFWAERAERIATREAALRRGLSEMPEERELLQLGLDLLKALPHSPRPPLPEVIAGLLRHTERLALHLRTAADSAGFTDVRLTGGEDLALSPGLLDRTHTLGATGELVRLLPLVDWRARTVPGVPDEDFLLANTKVVTPAMLAAASLAAGEGAIPAIRYNSIMLFPTTNPERGILRAVQCQPTDPVSAALADGRAVARFPELAGWSALHCARRAVAEHRGWLASAGGVAPPHGWIGMQSGCSEPTMRTMGLLFTAARAALFLESIADGDPELALTVAGVAERLIARDSSRRDVVETTLHDFRTSRAAQRNDVHGVAGLLDVVRNLPAYAGSPAFSNIPQ
jgi:hypothetical protein